MPDLLDFTTLKLTSRPNQHLVAPEDLCQNAKPHGISPVYPVSPENLFEAWQRILEAAPRTRIKTINEPGLEIEAVQQSVLFRFQDRINFAAFSAGKDRSRLAVYSRSLVGYSDLGANRTRVRGWLELLKKALAT